jgi:serine/threonine-protein kinase
MILSTGPDRRTIPALSGLDGDRALTILEASGFTVVVDSTESDEPRGRVVDVRPEEGREVPLPADVFLTLSVGPPTFPMPDLVGLAEEDAVSTLDSLGLVLSGVETRFRFGLDQGIVIDQRPAVGAEVARGARVQLVVGERGRSQEGGGPS